MFKLHANLCTECLICQQICSWEHHGYFAPQRARIRIQTDWPHPPGIRVCVACPDRKCIDICPHQALSWEGWVHVDPERCDACGACVEICPVEGINPDPGTAMPLICDTCQGRYQCVKWCPTAAIEVKGALNHA